MSPHIAELVRVLGEKEGEFVIDRDEKTVGEIVGEADDCGLEGCVGTPHLVKWNEDNVMICCGKGMNTLSDNVQILI